MLRALALSILAISLAGPAESGTDPLNVVADTAVVHSLTAQVMAGVGTPALLVTGGADPHTVTLRPSEAARLSTADLVLWIGPEMTPWLAEALLALAPDTPAPPLLAAPGTDVLRYGFSDDAPADPHAWLDPANARVWVARIAAALAEADPANADRFAANAAETDARLVRLGDELSLRLVAVVDRPILVQHDAYNYLARAFGLRIAGAALLGDGTAAGAQRLARLADTAAAGGIACAFGEPGRPDGLLRAALGDAQVPVGTLDPEGRLLTPGPGLYEALMRDLAEALGVCAQAEG
jgi:zinc transport system substrate-binding protein